MDGTALGCCPNDGETALQLIEHGADIRAKDKNGTTPLHTAAFGDAPEIAKLLTDNGATF